MRQRSDYESWTCLWRYALGVSADDDAPIPPDLRHAPRSYLAFHLRRYQLLVRLYHRDPACCRVCLKRYSPRDLDALLRIYLLLFPVSDGNLPFLLELLEALRPGPGAASHETSPLIE